MTDRASSAPERQSAASAAAEWVHDVAREHEREWEAGRASTSETDITSLTRLLESRERPLLEQVSALREALDDHFPSPAEGLMGTDEDAAAQEAWAERRRTLLASTKSAAREFVARVREEEREACAEWLRSCISQAAIAHDFMDQALGGGCGCSECGHARWLTGTADAMVRARSQTEGA